MFPFTIPRRTSDFVADDEYFDDYHAYIFKNNIKPDDKDPY